MTTGNQQLQITPSYIYLIYFVHREAQRLIYPRSSPSSSQCLLAQVGSSAGCTLRWGWAKEKRNMGSLHSSGRKESSLSHLLCVRTCTAFHISLLSPKNDPARAAARKWVFLWKLMLELLLHFCCLKQMAPNSPASPESPSGFWQGWEELKINPKAEPSPPARLTTNNTEHEINVSRSFDCEVPVIAPNYSGMDHTQRLR